MRRKDEGLSSTALAGRAIKYEKAAVKLIRKTDNDHTMQYRGANARVQALLGRANLYWELSRETARREARDEAQALCGASWRPFGN